MGDGIIIRLWLGRKGPAVQLCISPDGCITGEIKKIFRTDGQTRWDILGDTEPRRDVSTEQMLIMALLLDTTAAYPQQYPLAA